MKLLKLEMRTGGATVHVNPEHIVAIFDVEGHANIKTTAGGERATISVKESAAEVVAMLSIDGMPID